MNIISSGLLARAMMDDGVAPLPGSAEHPRIVAYWAQYGGYNPPNDENPSWCGAALGKWCEEEDLTPPADWPFPDSWVGWGTALTEPVAGCVAVKKGTNTHVGIVMAINPAGARPWISGPSLVLFGGAQGGKAQMGEWLPWSDFKAFRAPPTP